MKLHHARELHSEFSLCGEVMAAMVVSVILILNYCLATSLCTEC